MDSPSRASRNGITGAGGPGRRPDRNPEAPRPQIAPERKKGGGTGVPPPFPFDPSGGSALHGCRNVGEGLVELGAEAPHGGDRGNGDESGDKAIFDGGGALFAAHQFRSEERRVGKECRSRWWSEL